MANKNEAKVLFTAETGKFNTEIAQMKSEMGKLRAELSANKDEMKANGETVEGLEKKHKILSDQYKVAQRETQALSQKLASAKKYFGENSIEANNLETKLIKAETAQARLGRAVETAATELRQAKDATRDTRTETEKLTDTIEEQQGELDDLKRKYSDATLEFGRGSREAKDLAREIDKLSSDLKENKSKMSAAEGAADKLDKSLDNVGDGADGAGGGFTVMKGALADLVSQGIQAAIGKLNEFVDYIWSLPETTRDIRQDFATLQTSFDNVGLSSEQATSTWKELYKVFGEDDRAIETANHIAKMAKDQKGLTDWVTITTGIWGTYQDSLPVEGLAEAANETAKTGKVTGGLADALNWSSEASKMFSKYMSEDVVTAEDAFNEALAECNTEQERQKLITETLTKLYGGAAETYRDTSGAMMEEKDAAAEQIIAENNLADAIVPVTNAWQNMKNELLVGVLPVIEKVSDTMVGALDWMREHPVAMKIIASVIGVLAAAITAITIVVVAWTVAQWALNSAILANPITWIITGIVAAIAAVVAIVLLVIEYWDQIVVAVKNACTAVVNALKAAWDWVVNLFSSIGTWIYDNVIKPVVDFYVNMYTTIWNGLVSAWNWVVGLLSTVGTWIYDNVIAPVAQFFVDLWNGIVNAYHTVVDPWIEIVRRISAIIYESVIVPVKQFFVDLWNGIVSGLQSAWQWCVDLFTTVATWVYDNVIKPVVDFYVGMYTAIWNGLVSAWNWITDLLATFGGWVNAKVVQPVAKFFSNLWSGFIKGAKNAWEGVKNVFSAVGGFFSKVFGIVKDKIVSVFQAGGKVFNNIKDGIVSVFKTVVNGLIRGLNKVISVPFKGLNNILDSIHGVTIVGVQPFSWLTWRAPIPQIPQLAKGGILTQPTLNIAGEAGPEAVIPLDRLQAFIDTAVDRSLQMNNLQALVNAVEDLADRAIELSINGRHFATATAVDTDTVNGNRMVLSKMGLALG